MKRLLLITGFLILFIVEMARVYFIMPFPGSQHQDTIDLAYWLNNNTWWLRIISLWLIAYPLITEWKYYNVWQRVLSSALLLLYAVIAFFFNFRFEADKMFYQPEHKYFAFADKSSIDTNKLVIGVSIKGEAKAYPIQVIGYHHQVRDTIGGEPVMITYCTVCRTGRAYKPLVQGKPENFRLVGMDHFNAMFEDATTKSWWQQATGVAITGPLKGTALQEIPSQQMTLAAWLHQYPHTAILQPDSSFTKEYEDLALYDNGIIKSSLEKRDSGSWEMKSWVIGIAHDQSSKAYDWNELSQDQVIEDSLPDLPLIIVLEKDTVSFHVYNRHIANQTLHFDKLLYKNGRANVLTDIETHSLWNMAGICTEGSLKGNQLQPVQASQEFWHAWQMFHPATTLYIKPVR
jgi:hypothetical protein